MRMCSSFRNPGEESDSDELEVLEEVEVMEVNDINGSDLDENEFEPESDSDFLPTDTEDEDLDNVSTVAVVGSRPPDNAEAVSEADQPSCSTAGVATGTQNGEASTSAHDLNEDDEEDETVRAIISAIKKPRVAPPEIKTEDFVTAICFHPEQDIIALATIMGDVQLYQYANEKNTFVSTVELHAKSCRDVKFSDDGVNLFTCSKDKSIMITDMETEKLKQLYESAHDLAINKLHVIDEHLFATGDDLGTVKVWDLRSRNEVFGLKVVEDYVSQLLTHETNKKLLLVSSGDGYLSTILIGSRKLYVQSEPYEEELTCMGTFRGDSKLVAGTSLGRLYTYNWGSFGFHSDMYPGIKSPISEMVPITDRIACVAGEEGIIRACHIAPFRNLGIVGQHSMPVESMDISNTGELIASSSHNNDVRFWHVKYFEDFGDIKYNEKHNPHKEKHHNLPSSKHSNATDFFADMAKTESDADE